MLVNRPPFLRRSYTQWPPFFSVHTQWPLFFHFCISSANFFALHAFWKNYQFCGNSYIKFTNFGLKLHFCTLNDRHLWESTSKNNPFFWVHTKWPPFSTKLYTKCPLLSAPVKNMYVTFIFEYPPTTWGQKWKQSSVVKDPQLVLFYLHGTITDPKKAFCHMHKHWVLFSTLAVFILYDYNCLITTTLLTASTFGRLWNGPFSIIYIEHVLYRYTELKPLHPRQFSTRNPFAKLKTNFDQSCVMRIPTCNRVQRGRGIWSHLDSNEDCLISSVHVVKLIHTQILSVFFSIVLLHAHFHFLRSQASLRWIDIKTLSQEGFRSTIWKSLTSRAFHTHDTGFYWSSENALYKCFIAEWERGVWMENLQLTAQQWKMLRVQVWIQL